MNIKERMILMFFSKRSLCIILSLAITVITVFAQMSGEISPALDIIKEKIELKKCATIGCDVVFDKADFDKALGNDVQFVTFLNLPSSSEGTLELDGVRVIENQTVARISFDELRFVPSGNEEGVINFSFYETTAKEPAIANCRVTVLSEINLAPETGSQTISTLEDIAAFKFLLAADPEGDKMSFDIVNYPKNGYVSVLDSDSGLFEYVPQKNYTGADYFEYTACDEYGNVSDLQRVEIEVKKAQTDVRFDDMKRHWGHNSAVRMSATGLMSGSENQDGLMCFEPENDISRGDFLAIALIMAGKENEIPYCENTDFADDDVIASNIKSYAQYAYEKGIVSGYPENDTGLASFKSDNAITRSEAAVIVERILSLPESKSTPEYVDASSIPDWANSSVSALYECGIMTGTGESGLMPESKMTKAQAAEMMCNVAQYIQDKNEQQQREQKPQKSIFNLFGLIG